MRNIFSLKPRASVAILAIVAVGFFAFLSTFNIEPVRAANGDVVITVQDELGTAVLGTTLTIACTGGANQTITDGGAYSGVLR